MYFLSVSLLLLCSSEVLVQWLLSAYTLAFFWSNLITYLPIAHFSFQSSCEIVVYKNTQFIPFCIIRRKQSLYSLRRGMCKVCIHISLQIPFLMMCLVWLGYIGISFLPLLQQDTNVFNLLLYDTPSLTASFFMFGEISMW